MVNPFRWNYPSGTGRGRIERMVTIREALFHKYGDGKRDATGFIQLLVDSAAGVRLPGTFIVTGTPEYWRTHLSAKAGKD